uniref:Docking protein 3-like n=1 Tax=Astyanax mexicanus TaxID=7994 RepID=A0A3B1IRT0_ASTMX
WNDGALSSTFGYWDEKVWCVLSADSMNGAARLELYEFRQASVTEGLSGKRSEGKKVILLRDCVQILEKVGTECPKNCSPFQMETTNKLFTFAAQTPDVQSWVQELCRLAFPGRSSGPTAVLHPPVRDHSAVEMKENSLYEPAAMRDFLVIAMGTEAALRCKLYGEYILTPHDDRILLKDHKTKQVLFSWPYCFIRKFGQDRLSFSFEAGRRCESGEGNFEFTTNQGDRIFKIVSGYIQNLPQSEKPGREIKPRPVEKVDTPPPQSMDDTCTYSTVNLVPYNVSGQDFSSSPKQRSIKKLSPTFRSLSLNAIEPPNKSQVRSINSCPSTTSSSSTSFTASFTASSTTSSDAPQGEEPLYATVTKPRFLNETKNDQKSHWHGFNDYVHQLDPLPDPPEDVDYSFLEEESSEMLPGDLPNDLPDELPDELPDDLPSPPFHFQSEDYIEEDVYSEPKDYDGRASWEVTREYQFPKEILGEGEVENGGEEEQTEGFFTYDNLMSRGKML